jgi:hypothetical protein
MTCPSHNDQICVLPLMSTQRPLADHIGGSARVLYDLLHHLA